MMTFFDCNSSYGSHPRPPFRYAADPSELLEEMDHCGIDRALVFHSCMRFGSPVVWNKELSSQIAGQPRLLGSWTILPEQTGELEEPELLIRAMQKHHVLALRAFPQEHHYSLEKVSFRGLFNMLSKRKIPLFVKENLVKIIGLAESFPDLRIVLVNQGPHSLERYLRPILDSFKNVYLDTSYYIIEGAIEEFCERYGPERLLFGTAFPDNCNGGAVLRLLHADITPEAREAVAGNNLRQLLEKVEL